MPQLLVMWAFSCCRSFQALPCGVWEYKSCCQCFCLANLCFPCSLTACTRKAISSSVTLLLPSCDESHITMSTCDFDPSPNVSGHKAGVAEDIEKGHELSRHLANTALTSFSWSEIGVTVEDRKTKKPIQILRTSHGLVQAGSIVALMGPSGSGKTTLLNVLAHRTSTMKAKVQGNVMFNGRVVDESAVRQVSTYVEQEDAMIGSLTLRETIDFAARLSMTGKTSAKERLYRIQELVESFGLQRQADTIVGTPLRKGLSGGVSFLETCSGLTNVFLYFHLSRHMFGRLTMKQQKRRLSVASQLVTSPQIIFLDEPTSGLDSFASFECMRYIKDVAKQHSLIVIASIHQPSTTTFQLFDQLLLLSEGRTCYFGAVADAQKYFELIERPIPLHINPAEFLLDLVNSDFGQHEGHEKGSVHYVQDAWQSSDQHRALVTATANTNTTAWVSTAHTSHKNALGVAWILLHRNFIKSYRDFIAYGTRVFMYFGLAIMMGTVWLRLSYHQSSIQPSTNAIFFGGAFMSFVSLLPSSSFRNLPVPQKTWEHCSSILPLS